MITKKIIAAAAAIVGFAGAGTAQAAYVTTYGHTANGSRTVPLVAYEEALEARDLFFGGGMPAVQNFESFDAGTSGPLSISFGSGDSAVTATLTGADGQVAEVAPGTSAEGRYSVGGDPASPGTKFWETRATSSGSTFELWFDNPVVKFGFFGVDVGDFDGVLELELLRADGTTIGAVGPGIGTGAAVTGDDAEGSVLYFGVTASSADEWFTGVRFRSFSPTAPDGSRGDVADDVFAFDSFTVVAAPRGTGPAPLSTPGTVALLGTALVGLALLRRRA